MSEKASASKRDVYILIIGLPFSTNLLKRGCIKWQFMIGHTHTTIVFVA